MKLFKTTSTLCLLAFSMLLLQPVRAQYTELQSVLGSGSGAMSQGNTQIMGTAGQPLIGETSNVNTHNGAGFWYQVGSCTPGVLGDVNGEGLANSTDGLVLLSYDAGLPLPQPFLDRISLGFGDVNLDNFTNSTDALVILSWEAGFPVPFPVGEAVCLPGGTQPAPGLAGSGKPGPPDEGVSANRLALNKAGGEKTVKAAAVPLSSTIVSGQSLEIPLTVEMSALSQKLGSFTVTLEWDPEFLQFQKYRGGSTKGFEDPVVNDSEANKGKLRLAHAYPHGAGGVVNILNLQFKVSGQPGAESELSMNFSAMAAAGSFANLLPRLEVSQSKIVLAGEELPREFTVENYPNPFNPVTHIRYGLPRDVHVKIEVYNVLGQRVTTLVNEMKKAGYHTVDFVASQFASGLYFYRITAGDPSAGSGLSFHTVKKMMLMK